MASSKDVFEPQVFGAGAFACGAFRGLGVAVTNSYLCGKVSIRARLSGQVSATVRLSGEVSIEPRLAGDVKISDCC